MRNCNISVVVCTYNSPLKKLRSTLLSILEQVGVDFEIIIADDGSKDPLCIEIENFFNTHAFISYQIINRKINVGTVINFYDGICLAKGEYVFGISPGDMLYDQNTLKRLYDFAISKNLDICFGDVVYYSMRDNHLKILDDLINAPCRPWLFSESLSVKKIREEFLLGNHIIGAAYFRRTSIAKKYLKMIVGVSKYVEDNTTTALMLMDGIRVYHFKGFVIWYEYGEGVSTCANQIWKIALRNDFYATYRMLNKLYPNDDFLKAIITYKFESNKLHKITKLFIINPLVLIRLTLNRYKKVSKGYDKSYDVGIINRLIYLGGNSKCK